ncbi:hypothetical protein NKI34_10430 [Mesorhizobium sp. M0700]|uniref:hypothetical protein n=1 Tax=Mesorhizobium sp. M0700 TaxID=2956988 RepID=UPI00333B58D1
MKADLKTILDDARARDTALINLIIFTDRQAMALFRVYVTVGAATAVAAASGLLGVDPLLHFAGPSTAAIALVLAVACWFCLRAMVPSDVGLPGRAAEFWQWTTDELISEEHVLRAYLQQTKAVQDVNRATNERGAIALSWAKRLGIAAPIAGLAIGAIGLILSGI